MKIELSLLRKLTWPINAVIYNICRIIPFRSNKIWVFGGLSGKGYDDNSKYLYEYIFHKPSSNIVAIWLSNRGRIVQDLQEKGYKAYYIYSIKGIWYALRCGVAFYSHGLSDFGYIPLVGGAKIVALWHGVGFKKIYNSTYQGIWFYLKILADGIFNWVSRNYSIATSLFNKWQIMRNFNAYARNIYITGQPRNDVLQKNIRKEEVLPDIDPSKRWILYMPTYRGKALGSDAMERIVKDMYENKILDKMLTDNNYVLIAKLHPLTPKIAIRNRANFIILDYTAVKNNQELLTVSEIMITDYSSCFVDFALLDRPIIFYTPDEKQFIEKSEVLDDDFFRISAMNKATTPMELAKKLSSPSCVVCNATNDMFEDEEIRGTCYSENVYNVISKKINICTNGKGKIGSN